MGFREIGNFNAVMYIAALNFAGGFTAYYRKIPEKLASIINSAPTQIVEANGWTINDKGDVILTATAPSATLDIPWMPKSGCNTPEPSS